MAVFTRINGDAAGVVNVDAGRSFANGAVINTGIAAPLTFYNITLAAGAPSGSYGNLAAELTTGGAVETIIRIMEGNATVLAYQVDASTSAGASQISVITERDGWVSGALATQLQTGANQWAAATGGNIGATGNIWASSNSITVNTSRGFKTSAS
jgi:hypothetical protein